MMQLEVIRYSSKDASTLGILMDVSGLRRRFLAYTLEDAYRSQKVKHETRIPQGSYEVNLRTEGGFHNRYLKKFGPDFHRGMLHVQNVPNYEFILIHCGNDNDDTSGCLLVGNSSTENIVKDGFIGSSVDAYKRIYLPIAVALTNGESVRIDYLDYDTP
jgi:hypothetical protein